MDDTLTIGLPKVVFIGGTGRSGTNITRKLLDRHPLVASLPFETRFIVDPDGIADFYRSYKSSWSPFLADRRLKRLERLLNDLASESYTSRVIGQVIRTVIRDPRVLSPRRYHKWSLNEHFPTFHQQSQKMLDRLRDFTYSAYWVGTESYTWRSDIYHAGSKTHNELTEILGNFIQTVLYDFLESKNKSVFIEDSTWNILFAKELAELVPGSRIIHVYRDPRDVIASMVQQRWCPDDVEQAAMYYQSLMLYWFNVRSNLSPDSYFELALEQLVEETEVTVRALCHFIDIPFDYQLLDIDLSKSNTGRWKHDIDPHQLIILQNLVGDIVQKLGYEN